jgi:CMP-N-acetylneuraminic acid synthetase
MNSDTPETDKVERMAFAQEYMVPTEFARKLERERDEARAEIKRLQKGGCARDQMTTQFCAEAVSAIRERDEARELAQQMSESNQVLLADVRFYRNAWEQLKKKNHE